MIEFFQSKPAIVIYSNTKKGGLSFNHQLLSLIFGVLVSMPGGQAHDDSTVTAIKSKTLPGNACRAAEAVEDIELLKEDRGLRSSGNTSAGWPLKGSVAQKSLWVFEAYIPTFMILFCKNHQKSWWNAMIGNPPWNNQLLVLLILTWREMLHVLCFPGSYIYNIYMF